MLKRDKCKNIGAFLSSNMERKILNKSQVLNMTENQKKHAAFVS